MRRGNNEKDCNVLQLGFDYATVTEQVNINEAKTKKKSISTGGRKMMEERNTVRSKKDI